MEFIVRPWKRFADFRGRSSRTEFGLFHLTVWLLIGALTFLPMVATSIIGDSAPFILWILPSILLAFAAVIPSLSVGFRRVQDVGRPGWLYLIAIVATVVLFPFGFIAVAIVGLIPGTKGTNSYGPDPRDDKPDLDEAANRIFG